MKTQLIHRPGIAVLAVMVTPLFLSACGGDNKNTSEPVIREVATPADDVSKSKISSVNRITLSDVEYEVDYMQVMKTGYADNGEVFGALKDENGNLITHPDGSTVICNGTSNSPTVEGSGLDFTSIIEKEEKLYMVSQFECQVGAIYTAELQQSADGVLSPVPNTLTYVDQSEYKGGWVHCAGMKTPWNSHLGSEEYEPDARNIEDNGANSDFYYASAKHYFGGDTSKLNPYYYGWTPEVKIENGEAVYQKHYALGRAAHELAYVMPDQKTVYITDDGVNDGFYRFVADTSGDLSSGMLYAVKWSQTSSSGGGAADLTWIPLGHATDAAVKALAISGTLNFSDVLDADDVVDEATGTCNTGYTYTNTGTGRECLAFKDINGDNVVDATDEALAARLETRRVAAMKGATTEFRKFEGFTYNPDNKKAYLAMSAIERGMEAGYSIPKESDKYDRGGNNDIQLAYNKCGAVYEVGFDSVDTSMAVSMTSIVEGVPLPEADEYGNGCHADYISNPDNVSHIPGSDVLMIGEDTSKHTNNVVWGYNLNAGTLTRLATVEMDAETTSPYYYEVGGKGYIALVSQHPMEDQEVDQSAKESSIGFIGPIIHN